MTQTRKEALTELLEKVEERDISHAPFWKVWPPENPDGKLAWAAEKASKGSHYDAIAFVKATLPGWGWRMAECSVSDDAWVFPDFNCPEHGPRLRATLDQSVDWCGLTDVDQRPPGSPARALFRSALIALIAQEPDQ